MFIQRSFSNIIQENNKQHILTDMKLFKILTIIIPLTFLTGWFLLRSLTVHPVKIFGSVFVFTVFLALSLVVISVLVRKGTIAAPITAAVAFFFIGYLVNAKIFLSQKESFHAREITRDPKIPGGHTAIVYFTHGEPETYNPIGWLNQFREFDEQGVKFVPFVARPVFIYMLRKKYLQVGKSNHRQGHINMLKKVEEAYRQEGDSTTKFYISFLDDYPKPDDAVIQALNEGADKIVVVTVFLTVSNHTAEGRKLVEQLDCKNRYGVDIRFTDPLWNSKTLMEAFIDKIDQRLGGTPKEKIAVALIGHGQPVEWDKEWPTLTEQEINFRERIIEMLITDGFRKENLGIAWMAFKEPKPVDLMENFVNNGVEKIFYFAASISADAIHSQSDIPELVNKYPFPENIEVINLGAWNAHPLVIRAIKERIDIQLAAFKPTQKSEN